MVLLLCKYGLYTTIWDAPYTFCFSQLVDFVCCKWNDLNEDSVLFAYTLPRHAICILDSNTNIQNMLSFVCSTAVDCVDVAVYDQCIVARDVGVRMSEGDHSAIDSYMRI